VPVTVTTTPLKGATASWIIPFCSSTMVVLDTVVEPDFMINPEPKTGAEAI
jgi:hypothetical protein